MAAFFFKQLFTQLVSVSQVTVVRQRNAIRRVDVRRLCLGGAGTASRRVTNVTNTHIALHTLHMASFKTSLTSPFALRKRKQLFASMVMMPAASWPRC